MYTYSDEDNDNNNNNKNNNNKGWSERIPMSVPFKGSDQTESWILLNHVPGFISEISRITF